MNSRDRLSATFNAIMRPVTNIIISDQPTHETIWSRTKKIKSTTYTSSVLISNVK